MLKDEPVGKKTSLVEQGAVTGTQGKKTLGRRGRMLLGTTRMLLGYAGRLEK